MEIFEKATEIKKVREEFKKISEEFKEKVDRLNNELKDSLSSQFVDMPYQLKEVEANYQGNNNDRDIIKFYYPILNVPKGFTKKDENFYRIYEPYKSWIDYTYTLIDEKEREVTILEHVDLKNIICKIERNSKISSSCIPSENINFHINIFGEQYNLYRKISHEQLTKEISGKYTGKVYIKIFSS